MSALQSHGMSESGASSRKNLFVSGPIRNYSRCQVKNEVDAPPTPFHFSRANTEEEATSSPAFALPERKEGMIKTTTSIKKSV
ncbi:unnamed protein product [Ixodes persulcatus]